MKWILTGFIYIVCMATLCANALAVGAPADDARIQTLIIDGQSNHDWRATTAELRRILQEAGPFRVYVDTSPSSGLSLESFEPGFFAYDVVVLNYNGERWSRSVEETLVRFVAKGGGLVVVHAADNAFPDWPEYNEMIGLGGWGGRAEEAGPYVRWRKGKASMEISPGPGGSHGQYHAFRVKTRTSGHPIVKGLPREWVHGPDELYDRLRGPAKNLTVLATAFSDPKAGGSGEEEPVLFVIRYGKGRIFHTVLGHDAAAMRSMGFAVTLRRGTEWAATGKVRQKRPKDFSVR